MNSCIYDPALLYQSFGQELIGLWSMHVDDALQIGNDSTSDLFREQRKCLCARTENGISSSLLDSRLKQKITFLQFTRRGTLLNLKLNLMVLHTLILITSCQATSDQKFTLSYYMWCQLTHTSFWRMVWKG